MVRDDNIFADEYSHRSAVLLSSKYDRYVVSAHVLTNGRKGFDVSVCGGYMRALLVAFSL